MLLFCKANLGVSFLHRVHDFHYNSFQAMRINTWFLPHPHPTPVWCEVRGHGQCGLWWEPNSPQLCLLFSSVDVHTRRTRRFCLSLTRWTWNRATERVHRGLWSWRTAMSMTSYMQKSHVLVLTQLHLESDWYAEGEEEGEEGMGQRRLIWIYSQFAFHYPETISLWSQLKDALLCST